MRVAVISLLAVATACANAQARPESYALLLREDGHTWCAYTNPAEFKSEATRLKPTESVRITYSSNKLIELTYQTEAESGDWIVIDKYTPSNGEVLLRRANLMAQDNLQIIQEAVVHGNNVDPFHLVSVTTLDGKKAEPSNVDFPSVKVLSNLLSTPFVKTVAEMRRRSMGKLCK